MIEVSIRESLAFHASGGRMATIPRGLSLAKTDARLRGAGLAVYIWCLEHLDCTQYRRVKVLAVASACGRREWASGRALRTLWRAGYIERRRSKARNASAEYRLRMNWRDTV